MQTIEFIGRRAPEAPERASEFALVLKNVALLEGPGGEADYADKVTVRIIGRDVSAIPFGCQVTVSCAPRFSGSGRDKRTSATTAMSVRWVGAARSTDFIQAHGRISYTPIRPCKKTLDRFARIRSEYGYLGVLPDGLREQQQERLDAEEKERGKKKRKKGIAAQLPEGPRLRSTEGLRGREKVMAACRMACAKTTRGGKDPVAVLVGEEVYADFASAALALGCAATTVSRAAKGGRKLAGKVVAIVGEPVKDPDVSMKAAALLALVDATLDEIEGGAAPSAGAERDTGWELVPDEKKLSFQAAGPGLLRAARQARVVREGGFEHRLRRLDDLLGGGAPFEADGRPDMARGSD
ncbi:hypothetical protein [Senegalimassilia anaerobia]